MNYFSIAKSLTRPKTLIASVSPVLMASSWALKTDCFDFSLFILLLSTALSLQILSNIANDYFDGMKGTDNLRKEGPSRLTAQNATLAGIVKRFLYASFMITLGLGLILSFVGGPIIAAIFAIAIICAVLYTAGPFAISYMGKAEPFAFAFFGPIPTFFAAYVFSKTFSLSSLLLGCLPGLYSLILITINNLRDYETDKAHLKLTLIVKKGRDFGKNLVKLSLIAMIGTTFALSIFQPKILFSLIIIPEMMRYYYQIKKASKPEDFSKLFKQTARIYFLSTLLWICFYMI